VFPQFVLSSQLCPCVALKSVINAISVLSLGDDDGGDDAGVDIGDFFLFDLISLFQMIKRQRQQQMPFEGKEGKMMKRRCE